jgi:hypothetical protein
MSKREDDTTARREQDLIDQVVALGNSTWALANARRVLQSCSEGRPATQEPPKDSDWR